MTETLQPQTDMGRGGVPPRIITGVATAALCSECPLLNKGLVEAGVPLVVRAKVLVVRLTKPRK